MGIFRMLMENGIPVSQTMTIGGSFANSPVLRELQSLLAKLARLQHCQSVLRQTCRRIQAQRMIMRKRRSRKGPARDAELLDLRKLREQLMAEPFTGLICSLDDQIVAVAVEGRLSHNSSMNTRGEWSGEARLIGGPQFDLEDERFQLILDDGRYGMILIHHFEVPGWRISFEGMGPLARSGA
jgi:hypothetical protein